jgi:Fe-S cluster assembly protein SufB
MISAKKREPQFLLAWRLKAYEYRRTMHEPHWAHLRYPTIDFDAISYYSAPAEGQRAQEPQ